MYSFASNYCCVCGRQLAPDDFDAICCDCDNIEYTNIGPDGYEVEITIHTINGPICHKLKLADIEMANQDDKFTLTGTKV